MVKLTRAYHEPVYLNYRDLHNPCSTGERYNCQDLIVPTMHGVEEFR